MGANNAGGPGGPFGDPSENVARFERASPAYPQRIGEDEAFWAQYRRDELEAKVSSVAELYSGALRLLDGPADVPSRLPKLIEAEQIGRGVAAEATRRRHRVG